MWFRGWLGLGLALALLQPGVVLAQARVELPDVATQTRELNGLCMTVGEHSSDGALKHAGDPIRFDHLFERLIVTAAGARQDTDPEVVRRKVQALWASRHPYLRCSNVQFDLDRGSVLKYAVSSANDSFIDQMIEWGVDLNQTDFDANSYPEYGTVLDYVQVHIGVNGETAMAGRLRGYYRKLRNAGAYHHREMTGAEPMRRRLEQAFGSLRSAIVGRPRDDWQMDRLLRTLRASGSAHAGARLEGESVVGALEGHPCSVEVITDNAGVRIISGSYSASVPEAVAQMARSRHVISMGWGAEGVERRGAEIHFPDGPTSTFMLARLPDEASARRVMEDIRFLRTHCNPLGYGQD